MSHEQLMSEGRSLNLVTKYIIQEAISVNWREWKFNYWCIRTKLG